ncbi:hypothetical protein FK484_0081 [Listeria phage LP-031]|uniref:Uncharacterized protein n=1 Tax=Listeria phage LP-031 TaxID=2590049 RepID=A0A514U782_9CAUD|nr:hypothetical protein FK484_0081 [Listeria phage LP-031]
MNNVTIEATLTELGGGRGDLKVDSYGEQSLLLTASLGIVETMVEEASGGSLETKKVLFTIVADHFNEVVSSLGETE